MAQVFAALSLDLDKVDGRSSAESPSVGCTLKPGSIVVIAGVEYRIVFISAKGVVRLDYRFGDFAMYTDINACKQLELSL